MSCPIPVVCHGFLWGRHADTQPAAELDRLEQMSTAGLNLSVRQDMLSYVVVRADMDGQLRLMEGGAGAGFEFGRLEIFMRGFWSNICSGESELFTQDSAQVACRLLGYDGGASIVFMQPFAATNNPVRIPHTVVLC